MKSFVQTKNLFFGLFLTFFFFSLSSSTVFGANGSALNLTGEYVNNPSTNSGFQIVPDCSANGKAECGWADLLQLVRNIMSLLLFLSASIAVLSFIYAGFLYLTAFGDMGKVEQAHGIFSKVVIGFLFVFLGWLIVATILKIFGVPGAYKLLNTTTVTGV